MQKKQNILTFDKNNFNLFCNHLAKKDATISTIIKTHGIPPIYQRKPGFETLIHIILEQQVSLASAKAAFLKLKAKTGTITPSKLLVLSDVDLRDCYFSRQKVVYARELAHAILTRQINLKNYAEAPDETIRTSLTAIKGIGNWTADVYLMMCLQRPDLFPIGDIALVNSIKHEMQLPQHSTREELLQIAENWKPYRTIASFIFWHAYIQRKGIRL